MAGRKLIALMGPTASGKTGLAVELVQEFPLDIVSVDSAQVYRGLDIGAAKPDPDTLARAPHRLLDVRDPSEAYSAAEFRDDALREITDIHGRARVPLLVGGTMLYFRALLDGLSPLPSADPDVRRRLSAEAEREGWDAMHRRLADLDPEAASRIHPNDPQRIQRALEVIELTGEPISRQQAAQAGDGGGFEVLKLVVTPPDRATLHRRIEQRFDAMLAEGFLDEVRRLRARGDLDPSLPALRSVGYRQAWAHLAGECDAATMRRRAIAATRQLAKRQLTWLRREEGALWYDLSTSGARRDVFERVRRFLETEP